MDVNMLIYMYTIHVTCSFEYTFRSKLLNCMVEMHIMVPKIVAKWDQRNIMESTTLYIKY